MKKIMFGLLMIFTLGSITSTSSPNISDVNDQKDYFLRSIDSSKLYIDSITNSVSKIVYSMIELEHKDVELSTNLNKIKSNNQLINELAGKVVYDNMILLSKKTE